MLGKGKAEAITDADIAQLADSMRCHPAHLEAIAEVESAGFGWFSDGRIKILFEKHWFYKLTSGNDRQKAVARGLARKNWVSPKNGGYADQKGAAARYKLLSDAISINEEAAYQSVSIGRFQIMGFNHDICGFETAADMWLNFLASERHQLRAFANFLRHNNLTGAIRSGDFETVEARYNGGGLGGAYARKMRQAAEKLKAGKWKGYVPGSMPAEPEIDLQETQVITPDPAPEDNRPNWTPDEDRDPDEVGGPLSQTEATGAATGAVAGAGAAAQLVSQGQPWWVGAIVLAAAIVGVLIFLHSRGKLVPSIKRIHERLT